MSIVEKVQWQEGMQVEAFLDKYLTAHGWTVIRATPQQERLMCLGDRRIEKADRSLWVEYKSGVQTFYTGNVFLETVSVDTASKPGWLYTCKADYLLYACVLNGCILVFKPEHLRSILSELKGKYPEKSTNHGQNDGYRTHGLCIPLDQAKQYAYKELPL